MTEERQIDAISIGISANVAGLKASLQEAQRVVNSYSFKAPGQQTLPLTVVLNHGVAQNQLKALTTARTVKITATVAPTRQSISDFRKDVRAKLAEGAGITMPFTADLKSAKAIKASIQGVMDAAGPVTVQVAWAWADGPPPSGATGGGGTPGSGGGGGGGGGGTPSGGRPAGGGGSTSGGGGGTPSTSRPGGGGGGGTPATPTGGGTPATPTTPSQMVTRPRIPSVPTPGRSGGPVSPPSSRTPAVAGGLPPRVVRPVVGRSNTEFQPGVGAVRQYSDALGFEARLKRALALTVQTGNPNHVYSVLGPFQASSRNITGIKGEQINLQKAIDEALSAAQRISTEKRGGVNTGPLREYEEFVPRDTRFTPETMDRAGIAQMGMGNFIKSAQGRAVNNGGDYSPKDIAIADRLRKYLTSIRTQMHAEDPKAFKMAFDSRRGSTSRLTDMGLSGLAGLGGVQAGLKSIGDPTPDYLETLAASDRHNKDLLTKQNVLVNARKRALGKDRVQSSRISEKTGKKVTIPSRGLPYVQSTGVDTVQSYINLLDKALGDKEFDALRKLQGRALGGGPARLARDFVGHPFDVADREDLRFSRSNPEDELGKVDIGSGNQNWRWNKANWRRDDDIDDMKGSLSYLGRRNPFRSNALGGMIGNVGYALGGSMGDPVKRYAGRAGAIGRALSGGTPWGQGIRRSAIEKGRALIPRMPMFRRDAAGETGSFDPTGNEELIGFPPRINHIFFSPPSDEQRAKGDWLYGGIGPDKGPQARLRYAQNRLRRAMRSEESEAKRPLKFRAGASDAYNDVAETYEVTSERGSWSPFLNIGARDPDRDSFLLHQQAIRRTAAVFADNGASNWEGAKNVLLRTQNEMKTWPGGSLDTRLSNSRSMYPDDLAPGMLSKNALGGMIGNVGYSLGGSLGKFFGRVKSEFSVKDSWDTGTGQEPMPKAERAASFKEKLREKEGAEYLDYRDSQDHWEYSAHMAEEQRERDRQKLWDDIQADYAKHGNPWEDASSGFGASGPLPDWKIGHDESLHEYAERMRQRSEARSAEARASDPMRGPDAKIRKLRAMADQSASPNEAAVAKNMLRKKGIPGYSLGGKLGQFFKNANIELPDTDKQTEGLLLEVAERFAGQFPDSASALTHLDEYRVDLLPGALPGTVAATIPSAVGFPSEFTPYKSRSSRVSFHPEMLAEPGLFAARDFRSWGTHHPSGMPRKFAGVAQTFAHELGHVLDFNQGSISALKNLFGTAGQNASGYGATHPAENFADWFSKYLLTGKTEVGPDFRGDIAGFHRSSGAGLPSDVFRALSNRDISSALEAIRAQQALWTPSGSEADTYISMAAQGSHRALGGKSRKKWDNSGAYIVGEQGDEVFVPESAGWIIPHRLMDQLPKRFDGGATGEPVNHDKEYLPGETRDEYRVRRAGEEKERREHRRALKAELRRKDKEFGFDEAEASIRRVLTADAQARLGGSPTSRRRPAPQPVEPAPAPEPQEAERAAAAATAATQPRDALGRWARPEPVRRERTPRRRRAQQPVEATAGQPITVEQLRQGAQRVGIGELHGAIAQHLEQATGATGESEGGDILSGKASKYVPSELDKVKAYTAGVLSTLQGRQERAFIRSGMQSTLARQPQRAPGVSFGQLGATAPLLGGRSHSVERQGLAQDALAEAAGFSTYRKSLAVKKNLVEASIEYGKANEASAEEIDLLTQKISGPGGLNEAMEFASKGEADATVLSTKYAKEMGGLGRMARVLTSNMAGVVGGTILMSAAMKGVQTVIDAVTPAVGDAIDVQSGLQSKGTAVTAALAAQTKAAHGNVNAVLAMAAAEAGLSGDSEVYIRSILERTTAIKAGSLAQQQASDLYRASAGVQNGSPSGLYGGTGGIMGSSFFAPVKGYSEIIQGDISAMTTTNKGAGVGGFGATAERAAQYVTNQDYRAFVNTGREAEGRGSPLRDVANAFGPVPILGPALGILASLGDLEQDRKPADDLDRQKLATSPLVTDYISGLNDNIKRGGGKVGGAQFTYVNPNDPRNKELIESAVGAASAASGGMDVYGMTNASRGFILSINGAAAGADEYTAAMEAAARGGSMPSEQSVRDSMVRQREITQMQISANSAFQVEQMIPQKNALAFYGDQPLQPGVGIVPPRGPALGATVTGGGYGGFSAIDATATAGFGKYASIAKTSYEAVSSYAAEGLQKLKDAGVTGIDQYKQIGDRIQSIRTGVANSAAVQSAVQYNHQLYIMNRSLRDAAGLLGKAGGANNLGAMQRQEFLLGRQSTALSLGLSQRQINFQRAQANFQAPGDTSMERAGRQEQAKIEADYAQKQLNISKKQYTVGGQIFNVTAVRQLKDVGFAIADLKANRAISIDAAAAEQTIGLLSRQLANQGAIIGVQLSKEEAIFAAKINESAQIAAVATGTAFAKIFEGVNGAWKLFDEGAALRAEWIKAAQAAVPSGPKRGGGPSSGGGTSTTPPASGGGTSTTPPASSGGGSTGGGGGGTATPKLLASGTLSTVSGATRMIVGEAGAETLAILRNPRAMGVTPQGGGGGGVVVNINNPSVRNDADIAAIATAVEKVLNRRSALIGMRSLT